MGDVVPFKKLKPRKDLSLKTWQFVIKSAKVIWRNDEFSPNPAIRRRRLCILLERGFPKDECNTVIDMILSSHNIMFSDFLNKDMVYLNRLNAQINRLLAVVYDRKSIKPVIGEYNKLRKTIALYCFLLEEALDN